MPDNLDPYQIDSRSEKLESLLLDRMLAIAGNPDEQLSFKDCYTAMASVQRVAYVRHGLKEKDAEPERVGSAVRKYQQSFKTPDAARRRAAGSGPGDVSGFDPDADDTTA